MRHTPQRLLTLWLCLLSCLFNGAAMGQGLVICVDDHGHTRIEVGCPRDGAAAPGSIGASLACCGDDEGDHCPGPCSDTPVTSDTIIARAATHSSADHAVAAPAPLVAPQAPALLPAVTACLRSLPSPARPPDSLMRLRCVKLLV
jgi:hypothetical protein